MSCHSWALTQSTALCMQSPAAAPGPAGLVGRGVQCWDRAALSQTSSAAEHVQDFNSLCRGISIEKPTFGQSSFVACLASLMITTQSEGLSQHGETWVFLSLKYVLSVMPLLAVAMVRRELCWMKSNLAVLVNRSKQRDLSSDNLIRAH